MVSAVSFASPGWIQLVGAWNPLKILADFISKWRAENTKREANHLKYQNERFRIQAELAARILEAAPKIQRYGEGGASRLIDFAEGVVTPTTGYIARVSRDNRIVAAEIVHQSEDPRPRLPRNRQA